MSTVVAYPRRFASLVKIEHTVFALPFAYVGALPRGRRRSERARPRLDHGGDGRRAVAGDGAEPADRRGDRRAQPADGGRELPAGRLTPLAGRRSSASPRSRSSSSRSGSSTRSCRWLWPIPVVGFVVYPYLKRVTWLAHLWLGAVDGLAPIGAWVAIRGDLPWQAWALGGAVASGSPGSTSSTRSSTSRSTGRRACTRGRPAGASAASSAARACCTCSTVWLLAPAGARTRRRRAVLDRRRGRRRSPLLRALARPPGRPAPPRRRVLHDERRDQRHLLRVRARGCARPVIAARKLGRTFGAKRVIRDLDLDVERGGFLLRHRAERLREDDAAAADRGPARARPRASSTSMRRASGSASSATSRSSTGS